MKIFQHNKWEMMEGREAINFEKSAEDNLLMCIYCNRVLLTKEIRGYMMRFH